MSPLIKGKTKVYHIFLLESARPLSIGKASFLLASAAPLSMGQAIFLLESAALI